MSQQEDLNFLLTNRIPRAALTRFMGWFSKIENSIVRDASIACWRMFSDHVAAGRPQLPPDQPHPAGGADAVHGLVQQDREFDCTRRLDLLLADVFRSCRSRKTSTSS